MSTDDRAGEVFTRYYAAPDLPLSSDNSRFRNRLSGLFQKFWPKLSEPGNYVKREVGIDILNHYYIYGWDKFFKDGKLQDLLDVITAIFRLCSSSVSYAGFTSRDWRDGVQRIFDEERLSYLINPDGGVRLRIDQAF